MTIKNRLDEDSDVITVLGGPAQFRGCPRSLSTCAGLVATLFLIGGCTTLGPDFETPEAAVKQEWMEATNPELNTESDEFRDWWTTFDDEALNTLIQMAYEQNLPLQIAALRILEARAQLGIAVGTQYPQVQEAAGQASMNEISENRGNSANSSRFFYDYQAGFNTSWEIDFWGRFRRGVESAGANLVSEVANYDDVLVSLTGAVAQAYVQMRTFEERIKFASDNVEAQKRSLQIADVRFRNGAVTELDVTQATSLLRDTESLIPGFQIGVRQSTNALSFLLGMPPSGLRDILGGPGAIPATPEKVNVGMPAELLRRRPDIRRAELDAATQSAQIGIAQTDLYPRFSLFGSIGLQTSSHGGRQSNQADTNDFFSSDSITYGVGPSFQWPIFNYGRLRNNVRVQDARYQQLVVNYQNSVLAAAQEVEDGLVAFLKSQEQARFLTDSVKAGERSVELSVIQYRDGAVDYQRVIDSQTALTTRQDRWTVARGNAVLGLVATYAALGGGWQIREGKDPINENNQEEMRTRTNWGKLLPPDTPPATLDPPPPAREQKFFNRPDW